MTTQGLPDDRALLAAHVAGDAEAFGVLFSRHRNRLWAVALGTLGEPEEAADALQDAMVNAFRRAGSFRGDAAVTTWLHRIVVNACLDRIRRRTVRLAEPLPEDDELSGQPWQTASPLASPDRPDEVALANERREAVRAALSRLPADQRAALVLVDMEGYPVSEAAEILQCPEGTVKSRCSRGRARLAPLLADPGPASGNPAPTSHVAPVTPEIREPGGEHR
ncbi:MAG: RNA polymerase sigma factor SigM [Nocardioidaceae bacterium]